jgi:hypothetical protein
MNQACAMPRGNFDQARETFSTFASLYLHLTFAALPRRNFVAASNATAEVP